MHIGTAVRAWTRYEIVECSPQAAAALRPSKNAFAVHGLQKDGGQYIDVGLWKRSETGWFVI